MNCARGHRPRQPGHAEPLRRLGPLRSLCPRLRFWPGHQARAVQDTRRGPATEQQRYPGVLAPNAPRRAESSEAVPSRVVPSNVFMIVREVF
jgi:hypothetical protein